MADFAPSTSIQDEIFAFLVSSPAPEEIIAFHASEDAQSRLRYLLDLNREGMLSDDQRAELDEASQLNHLFTMLKAKAHQTLAK